MCFSLHPTLSSKHFWNLYSYFAMNLKFGPCCWIIIFIFLVRAHFNYDFGFLVRFMLFRIHWWNEPRPGRSLAHQYQTFMYCHNPMNDTFKGFLLLLPPPLFSLTFKCYFTPTIIYHPPFQINAQVLCFFVSPRQVSQVSSNKCSPLATILTGHY